MKTLSKISIAAAAAIFVACGSQVVEFPECDCPVDTSPPNSVAPPGTETPPAPTGTSTEEPPPPPPPVDEDAGQPPVDEDAGQPEQDSGTPPEEDAGQPPVDEDAGPPPPPLPSCGDGTCNGNETCSTCSADCGQCPPPPPVDEDAGPPPPPVDEDAGPPPPPPEDECNKGPDKCGAQHGCCVSSCAHECNKGGKKHTTLTCPKYQGCFKECKAVCDKTFLECKNPHKGPGHKK